MEENIRKVPKVSKESDQLTMLAVANKSEMPDSFDTLNSESDVIL